MGPDPLENEAYKILKQLGLTSQQAKVYLALCRTEKASVRTISQIAQIDRSEVYRAVSGLQTIGLIEKIIDVPTKYRSMPLANSFSILLRHKKKEISEIESSVSKLALEKEKIFENINAKNENLILIPKTEPYLPKLKEKILLTKHSIDVLTTPSRDKYIPVHKETIQCLKKGVKMRVVTDDPENRAIFNKDFLSYKNYPSYSFRKTDEVIAAPLAILDKKEVFIFISDITDFLEATALISNNPRLVAIIQEYFNGLWDNSHEIIKEDIMQRRLEK